MQRELSRLVEPRNNTTELIDMINTNFAGYAHCRTVREQNHRLNAEAGTNDGHSGTLHLLRFPLGSVPCR